MGSRLAIAVSSALLMGASAMWPASAETPGTSFGAVKGTALHPANSSQRDTAPANIRRAERPSHPSAVVFGAGAEGEANPSPEAVDLHRGTWAARCPNGNIPIQTIRQMIQTEARAQNVDARLALAISQRESGFGQNNNSDAGARGPMQLIPSTAARYHVADACDATQNIRGGIAFLKDLNSEFGGNIFLMLAAYDAGQDRVYRARGIPKIPETVDYVATVANTYYGYDNSLQRDKGASEGSGGVAPFADPKGPKAAARILPINQPSAEQPMNPWIGGTVLYVDNGDTNR